MTKTEITVEVKMSLNELQKLLTKKGFRFGDYFTLDDHYFTSLKEEPKTVDYKKLIANSVLVRESKENDKIDRVMVYKNKKIDNFGIVVSESKTKVRIDNLENACKILKDTGLNNWCNIFQECYTYTNDNDETLIVMDVKGLGLFIEYEEFESIRSFSDEKKLEVLVKNIKAIGIKHGNSFSEKKAYRALHK